MNYAYSLERFDTESLTLIMMKEKGTIEGIYIAQTEGGEIIGVNQVEAVAGIGLKGDRNYFAQLNRPPGKRKPKKELTLVQQESVDMLNESGDYGTIHPGELRRNVVTSGINLNNLTGEIFFIGNIKVKGIELCEPCRHLEKMTGKKVMKPLVHKAGLRAQILEDGVIKRGDSIIVNKPVKPL